MFLFRKGVYSYEYIDNKEKFNEKSLPEKEDLYRHLSMEDVIDAHAKRVCKELKKKKIQENIMICIFKVIHVC